MSNQDFDPNPPVELHPDLDLGPAKERFAQTGRAQIKPILSDMAAGRFWACLAEELPWRLAYNDGDQALELTREQMAQMDPQQLNALQGQVFERASRQFQYAYSDYPVAQTINDPNQPKFYAHEVLGFVNSEPFLSMIREVTGIDRKLYADGHATCFQSGHFLTIHDDQDTRDKRAVAYVFNMTPTWRADWGAALQFYDKDYNITESFTPGHNILNIFKVPQPHAVTFVPPYAAQKRFGMTGWFHYAD